MEVERKPADHGNAPVASAVDVVLAEMRATMAKHGHQIPGVNVMPAAPVAAVSEYTGAYPFNKGDIVEVIEDPNPLKWVGRIVKITEELIVPNDSYRVTSLDGGTRIYRSKELRLSLPQPAADATAQRVPDVAELVTERLSVTLSQQQITVLTYLRNNRNVSVKVGLLCKLFGLSSMSAMNSLRGLEMRGLVAETKQRNGQYYVTTEGQTAVITKRD